MHFNAVLSTSCPSFPLLHDFTGCHLTFFSDAVCFFLKDTKDPFAHDSYLNVTPRPCWLNVYFTNETKSAKGDNAKLGGN